MLQTLAVENYRSLRSTVVPLGRLTVVHGANGTGKSNLYRALRLLADSLLPALAQLIVQAARSTQIWVVTHASSMIEMLAKSPETRVIKLQKEFSQTQVKAQSRLDQPAWRWAD